MIPAIFAVAASYGECDTTLVVTLLTIAISCQGFDVAALILNPLDLSPNYVGPLNSIVQSMFSTAALLAPFTVGVLVPNVSSANKWYGSKLLKLTAFFFAGFFDRMASSILDRFRTIHWHLCGIYNLGIWSSATMECTTKIGWDGLTFYITTVDRPNANLHYDNLVYIIMNLLITAINFIFIE